MGVTILLGALGSGLWEIAVKPGGSWFWHLILTAATFGSEYLKDRVYLEAARGNHEVVAQHAANMVQLMVFAVSGGAMGLGLAALKVSKRREMSAAVLGDANLLSGSFWRYGLWAVLLFILFLMAEFTVEDLKAKAANQAYTYFRQSVDICRPYLTNSQVQLFESRYAALRTKHEYTELTNELEQVASANKLRLPDFTPW